MRVALIILLLDVVVLKSGEKVSGKVVDKETHYEVTTEGGLRTYLKDEVEKLITSPKEMLGDADKLYEEAKSDYQKGVSANSDAVFREAAGKVTKAREAYAAARELFPEEKYAELDTKLVQIMQLLRMLRERMGSQIAGKVAPRREDPVSGGVVASEPDALTILRDAAKRSDAAMRASARERFRANRTDDVAVAAWHFLSRSDADWKLTGAALTAFQEYLAGSEKKTPLEAAKWIADRIAKDPTASSDALRLFAAAHLGAAPAGAETEKIARQLGFEVQSGWIGTMEGQVAYDLARWIRAGDSDLAVLAWLKEYRAVDTPNIRYIWSVALLKLAHKRGRGFERSTDSLNAIKNADKVLAEHIAALVKSIKAVANCGVCGGEAKLRCTNCHGKKDIHILCKACDGTGRMKNSTGGRLENCPKCKSTGKAQTLHCTRCKDGYFDCTRCDAARSCPTEDAICTAWTCGTCSGTGTLFKKVRWTCPTCRGLGEILAPKADPAKVVDR